MHLLLAILTRWKSQVRISAPPIRLTPRVALSLHAICTLHGKNCFISSSYECEVHWFSACGRWHSFAIAEPNASLGKRNEVAATAHARERIHLSGDALWPSARMPQRTPTRVFRLVQSVTGSLGRLRSHVVMQAVDSVVMPEITHLLEAAAAGDRQAAADLLPLVYDELRKLAAARMAAERPGHTLDATALVHEAYLRLVGDQQFDGKAHFFAAAAEAMRRVLVNHARDRNRLKRGGGRNRVDLDRLTGPAAATDDDLLELDDALDRLANEFPVAAELVKLRFFAGMTLGDAAEALRHAAPDRRPALGVRPGLARRRTGRWVIRRIVRIPGALPGPNGALGERTRSRR